MSRSAGAVRAAGIFVVLALLGACDGRTIRLGGCPSAHTGAGAVAWLGDSWVLVPGNQHTAVRDLARMAGAIGPNDDYTIDAAAAASIGTVPQSDAAAPAPTTTVVGQYMAQEASATKPQVLIMDGGTWDTLTAGGSSASVTAVITSFSQFLRLVASDGTVQQIIYFLPPDLPIPGVAALRTPLQQACAASAVPCHFLDLQQVWTGHPEYAVTDSGVPVPSSEGGAAIGGAIWSIMQTYCIGQ